ncbi:sigma-70 family RNA polymerase sigma factor [bacterium]|nr:sigma-70 family RNA polymerase sigma factor [bacterium]
MDYQNTYYELGDYAHNLIRSKARTLIGKAGFTSADCEDIEQELALDLLVRLENYDPKKSKRSTFMTRVVEHRIATLLEERHAACRDWRLCRESLDDPEWSECEEGSSRLDSQPDPSVPTGDELALGMDLRKALESLPQDLRELWDLLLDSNMYRVARETGIPRATLYYRLDRLRAALREAGL